MQHDKNVPPPNCGSCHEKELKDYAGGWIQERKGTDAPAFLKMAFPIIGLSCTAYLVIYMYGEIEHSERGPLVRQFNQISQTSPALMYIVAALALIYVLLVVKFAISKFKED